MNERTLAGRIAFWLLVPSLLAVAVAIGLVADASGHPPGGGRMLDGPLLFVGAIVLFILLTSMTFQALLIVRRPQTLTVRSLPPRIALLQFMLYGVVAVWVTLLVTIAIPLFSFLFFAAIVTLSVMLLTRIQGWLRGESAAMPRVRLSMPVRVALWSYSVLAFGALAYVVAAIANPELDADGIPSAIALLAFGLPLSLVAFPVTLLGALVVPGIGFSLIVLALLAIGFNVVVAQLLLWSPRLRATLVNWFFRLNDEEPAAFATGSSI